MPEIDVRKGMPSVELTREEFERRFRSRFQDPAFAAVDVEIAAVAAVAWDGYVNSRKAPRTRKAGPKFADPTYDLSGCMHAMPSSPHKPGMMMRVSASASC